MYQLLRSRDNLRFYGLSILAGISFILAGGRDSDSIGTLFLSNFTTYCSLTLFIIVCSLKISRNIRVASLLIVRVGYWNFIAYQYLTAFILGTLYLVSQYALSFSIAGIRNRDQLSIAILVMILYCLVVYLITFVLNMSNWNVKPIYTVIVSILIGLLFHYGYCLYVVANIYLGLSR
ncbi:hypothetical protein IGI37_002202 [Enterococcus sp. AZ194]|uniref:hypothetical protein n=1 Tax=Enterococcus sp. AZ194 TaxID=2774629 RepID=UPI003F239EEE